MFLDEELIGWLACGWLACGWLLSDVVGGHFTNTKKQTQTVDIFRLIIVLVSYLDSNFIFLYMF